MWGERWRHQVGDDGDSKGAARAKREASVDATKVSRRTQVVASLVDFRDVDANVPTRCLRLVLVAVCCGPREGPLSK